jgi:hypothetical protein
MTLQTQNLVMVGLGIKADRPPNKIQPKLQDGVHLRWAFKKDLGFPWYGFYLFRRKHVKRQGTCMSSFANSLKIDKLSDKQLDLAIGQFSSDINLALTNEFPPSPGADTNSVQFDLKDRKYLRFSLPQGKFASEVSVRIGFFHDIKVRVTVLSEKIPVAQSTVDGQAGELAFASFEFDKISAIEISGGQAALVDLCFVPVDQDATVGWEKVPNFPYPMALPVIHPDYPCTPGRTENLSMSRVLAKRRIYYGDPEQSALASTVPTTGVVSIVNGSPIVIGAQTNWNENLIGGMFQVGGDQTAYSIMTIINSNKLILSRNYNGNSNSSRTDYTISHDSFGQIHDCLVHLVKGGSNSGSMASRSIPIPIANTGTVSVAHNSMVVIGIGTTWSTKLTDLTLQIIPSIVSTRLIG